MGIVGSIIRSEDDILKPEEKSYWDYKFNVNLIPVRKVQDKFFLTPSEKREIRHELSGVEPVKKVVILENSAKKLGRFTTSQVKDMFDDMGFNVDVLISEKHFSDFDAVMNIGGYTIPGWVWLGRQIAKKFPSKEKLLLSKLSPGKDRLHLRIFEQNDGAWAIIAHTDINWLSINLAKVYKAHFREGEGDYVTGTIMIYDLLKAFSKSINKNEVFSQRDIDRTIRRAYGKSLVNKLKLRRTKSMIKYD